MFILHSSNKTENLLAHVSAVLNSAPLTSPFAQEIFLIQSQGMERWLSQQLASENKVWANFSFQFPDRFFRLLAQRLGYPLTDESFDRQFMVWRFEAALRQLDDDVYIPLRHYFNTGNQALKRFQLARELAQVFDQYQIMRPDLLASWQQGLTLYDSDAELWQRALWLRVTEQCGQPHRGALWMAMIDNFNQAETGQFKALLPERVSIFGVHSLPPLFLSFLQGLSRHCDVHYYLLNPAQVYWGDIPGKKIRAQLEHFDGHPLLASLGQQGREFQQIILERVQFELELDSFEEAPAANNLQQLQNDILANRQPEMKLNNDGSISIHACHSRMREVEVVKNLLLAALEKDTELALRDIVVMAPDIQLYEPFISAVFADIQHAVADRSLCLNNPALNVFINFLSLSQSRLGWQEVLDVLEQPKVYPQFDLTDRDLVLIRFWINDTGIRWGRNAKHKQSLGLPPLNENTWQGALERLLTGYAVAQDEQFVGQVLPYIEIEGSSAQALGGLHDFLQFIFKAGSELKQDRNLQEWGQLLYQYADVLLDDNEKGQRQQLNEILMELSGHFATANNKPIPLEVIIDWLKTRVSEHKSSHGFLRGQLTFCSMLPMRSIPFKVIVLMGMNDGEYPQQQHMPTFDLMSRHFRSGDRSRRGDDRYQFLEILLSARRQLIISYIGQSIQNNEAIPPSVIVNEVLDVMKQHYQLDDLITRHPLQAFSPRYFNHSEPDLFSYVQGDCQTARQLYQEKQKIAPWWRGSIPSETEEVIEIDDLFAFYRHPQRFFMQRQMGLYFQAIEAEAEEREPFVLDHLEKYKIQQKWLDRILHGQSLTLEQLQAQGCWLSGAPGQLEYIRQEVDIQKFVERINRKNIGPALPDQAVEIELENSRLVGKLSNLYKNGSLIYRNSNLKGKDFFQAWLHHLLINQLARQDTYLLSKDHELLFKSQYSKADDLQALVNIFLQGKHRPDVFFSESVFQYLQHLKKSKAKISPLQHTVQKLIESLQYEAELRLLFNSEDTVSTVFNQDFEQVCQTLVQPVWELVYEKQAG